MLLWHPAPVRIQRGARRGTARRDLPHRHTPRSRGFITESQPHADAGSPSGCDKRVVLAGSTYRVHVDDEERSPMLAEE